MKTYDELALTEQEQAVRKCLSELLEDVVVRRIRFNDALNGDDLQARIDRARQTAETMQTPWFAGEYVMEAAGGNLRSMAEANAEDCLYAEPGEHVLHGIVGAVALVAGK